MFLLYWGCHVFIHKETEDVNAFRNILESPKVKVSTLRNKSLKFNSTLSFGQ